MDLNEIQIMENLFDSSLDFTAFKSIDNNPENCPSSHFPPEAGCLPNPPNLSQEKSIDIVMSDSLNKDSVVSQTSGKCHNLNIFLSKILHLSQMHSL